MTEFVNAPVFAGSRPGHVFKMGPQGLGYYFDLELEYAIDDMGSDVGCAVAEDSTFDEPSIFTHTRTVSGAWVLRGPHDPRPKPAAEDCPKPATTPAVEEQAEEAQEAACDWPTHDSELPRLSSLGMAEAKAAFCQPSALEEMLRLGGKCPVSLPPRAPRLGSLILDTLSSRVQPVSGDGNGGIGGMTPVQREAAFLQSCGFFGVGGRMPSSLSYTTGSPEVKKTSSLVHDVDAGTSSMQKVYSPDPFNLDNIGGEG